MSDKLNNSLQFNQVINNTFIKSGDIVLDATCGNGNDTLSLAKLVGGEGLVYGFDIQQIAIDKTRDLLNLNGLLDRVDLICDSHENIEKYIDHELDFVIFNLGYLPEGDKSIKTSIDSTIMGIKKALDFMKSGAILLITIYRGHEGGLLEYMGVEKFAKELDQRKFNSFMFQHINQKNYPPITIGIEVRGGRLWRKWSL